jgi:hypothetical protein
LPEDKKEGRLSRRQFVGAAAGGAAAVGAGVLLAPKIASAATPALSAQALAPLAAANQLQSNPSSAGIPSSWDYQADVVVIGAGAAGMAAAIAAFEAGASVLVIEVNYDIGGHAITSGGTYGITDSPAQVFADLTYPTTVGTSAANGPNTGPNWGTPAVQPSFCSPYQDRNMCWTIANNSVATFNWLLANGVQFSDTAVANTPPAASHWNPVSGIARSNVPYWNGATSFTASPAAPAGAGGTALMRPMEATARALGVQFLLNFRMTAIIREQPYSGNVLGVTAEATGGRFLPGSTTPLQPYLTQGNIQLENSVVNIRANKGVVVATGGLTSNVAMRREYDPRLFAVYDVAGEPYSYATGDGEYAMRRIGAKLWATGNMAAERGQNFAKPGYVGCRYGYPNLHWQASSPIFALVGASGVSVSNWDGVVQVNMAGVRFVNESSTGSPEAFAWIDAAMSINAAAAPPDFDAGPIWTITDSAGVTRNGWTLGAPNTDPLFFYSAPDFNTLAQKINSNAYQTTTMNGATLQATVTRYNGLVAAGAGDTDFGKSSFTKQINTPPYYAAFSAPVVHDTLTGVHINSSAQVMDLDDNVIPNLYAAGECAGGMSAHGLFKCLIFGLIAGRTAAAQAPFTA